MTEQYYDLDADNQESANLDLLHAVEGHLLTKVIVLDKGTRIPEVFSNLRSVNLDEETFLLTLEYQPSYQYTNLSMVDLIDPQRETVVLRYTTTSKPIRHRMLKFKGGSFIPAD